MIVTLLLAAAVAAPTPLYEHIGCELATNDPTSETCASVLTVEARGGETVPLCCDVVSAHNLDRVFGYAPTVAIAAEDLPGGCGFIVTYAPAGLAWCAQEHGGIDDDFDR